jgi:hypothetical protein
MLFVRVTWQKTSENFVVGQIKSKSQKLRPKINCKLQLPFGCTAVKWFKCCAINRTVVDLIPEGVTGFSIAIVLSVALCLWGRISL